MKNILGNWRREARGRFFCFLKKEAKEPSPCFLECAMPLEGIFVKVLKGGLVSAGDKNEVVEQ
ncbi:hypothetical protein SYNTR_1351 [Candidatus Syntrophocurvum alkaliphilum]|uniref:Uncharacterized protein n=1 Tax=Candidatus Syntrophocurvum alkaliphilum TaxID=2293317 RepID=A0A6I6DJQ0_9FIRM|nr:hypothetical protein SYNTR_1351 [Candidatus Syntrophocurvum alkaliphilum]